MGNFRQGMRRKMLNITLRVDEETVKKVRKIAFGKNTTLTEMVRRYLKSVADSDRSARNRLVKELQGSYKRLSRDMGKRKWAREQLHER